MECKQRSDSAYDSVVYDQVKTRQCRKSQTEAKEVIDLSFRFYFVLRQSGFHVIVRDGFISGIRKKWKRSDSSDFDSVAPMTPLTTPIFDFQKVISALMTLYLRFRLGLRR